jgi:hypothetical protein
VDLPRAAKALNDAWRSLSSAASSAGRPMAVLDFRCGERREGGGCAEVPIASPSQLDDTEVVLGCDHHFRCHRCTWLKSLVDA